MFISHMPGSINRMIQMVHTTSPAWLVQVHTTMVPLQGFWNGVVYYFLHKSEDNTKPVAGALTASMGGSGNKLNSKSNPDLSSGNNSPFINRPLWRPRRKLRK